MRWCGPGITSFCRGLFQHGGQNSPCGNKGAILLNTLRHPPPLSTYWSDSWSKVDVHACPCLYCRAQEEIWEGLLSLLCSCLCHLLGVLSLCRDGTDFAMDYLWIAESCFPLELLAVGVQDVQNECSAAKNFVSISSVLFDKRFNWTPTLIKYTNTCRSALRICCKVGLL